MQFAHGFLLCWGRAGDADGDDEKRTKLNIGAIAGM